MKKFLCLVLIFGFMISFTGVSMAEERNIIIDPQSSGVFFAFGSNIWLQSGSIICYSFSDITTITSQSIVMELQRQEGQNWLTVRTWQKNNNSAMLDVLQGHSASSGVYRVKGIHVAGGETKISFSSTLRI